MPSRAPSQLFQPLPSQDNGLATKNDEDQHHRPSPPVLRHWLWEIILVVFAAAIVVAIFIILNIYNNQELPEGPYGIQINTMIALLTLCLRSALMIVAAEIIGQSKWTWFSRTPRPVADCQKFDEASRGLLGSLKIMTLLRLGFRGSPLAAVAAVVTVLSLAIGPFTQQASRTTPCTLVESNNATVSMATRIPGFEGYLTSSRSFGRGIGPKLKAALILGLTNPAGNDSAIQVNCPSGNCSFVPTLGVPYSTIGLCSKCADMSAQVTGPTGENYEKIFRFGDLNITLFARSLLTVGETNLSFAEPSMPEDFKQVARHAVFNASILTWTKASVPDCKHVLQPGNSSCVLGVTCALFPCLKDLFVNVTNGRLIESQLGMQPAVEVVQADRPLPWSNRFAIKSPCVIDGKMYERHNFSLISADTYKNTFYNVDVGPGERLRVPTDCLYTMGGMYSHELQEFLNTTALSGECDDFTQDGICTKWWLDPLYNKGYATYATLTDHIHGMTAAATNFFRADGFGPEVPLNSTTSSGNDTFVMQTPLRGNVLRNAVCLRLEWPWLLLPSILCLTTVALLAVMVARDMGSQEQPVWKSSLLPLLFFSLDARREPETTDATLPAQTLDDLQRRAEGTTVKLDSSKGFLPQELDKAGNSTDPILEQGIEDVEMAERGSESTRTRTY